MVKPNFFIIGAPKCGTTSLDAWLSEHPNVYMSPVKEPHYFAEHRAKRNASTLDEYLALFEQAQPDRHLVVGEGSTTTLHSPGAMERLHAFAPDGKIVIMLRDPVELVSSMYTHLKFRGVEDAPTMQEAWKRSFEREHGRQFPKTLKVGDPVQLTLTEMGKLGKHVGRALSIFPANHVHVILFDDLKANPAWVYQQTLNFLGLPDDGRTTFEAQNVAREHGRNPLSRILAALPHPVTRFLKKVGLANRGLVTKVVHSSTKVADKEPLPKEFVQELRAYFAEDVQSLEKLLGRDLTRWYESP